MREDSPKRSPQTSVSGDPAAWVKIRSRASLDIVTITPKYLGDDGGYVDIGSAHFGGK